MATALGIPQSKNIIRRHLATEMEALINPARFDSFVLWDLNVFVGALWDLNVFVGGY